MKSLLLPIWWITTAGLALSQNENPSAPQQAEILGEIPDATPAFTSPESLSPFQERLAQSQAIPRPQRLHLSATVYRSATSGPRTQLLVWTEDAHPLTFCSSTDFALISGIQGFTAILATPGFSWVVVKNRQRMKGMRQLA